MVLAMGDYKHWTWDPRTEDPRTRGSEDQGAKDQGPNSLALLHLAFMTEMQLVSMFQAQTYGCIIVGHRVYIVIHTVDTLLTKLWYFTLSAIFRYLFFTLQTQEWSPLLHARLQA